MNARDRNLLTRMESFFRLDYRKMTGTSFEGANHDWSNSTTCMLTHYESFFKHFSRIEVSTDLDFKELRSKNYPRIIHESDNPFLIIYFDTDSGFIRKHLRFATNWIYKGIEIRMVLFLIEMLKFKIKS